MVFGSIWPDAVSAAWLADASSNVNTTGVVPRGTSIVPSTRSDARIGR